MFSTNLASRILRDARSRGLVEDTGTELADSPSTPGPGTSANYWSAHLASLVNTGRLPEEMLNSLAWDAIGGEAGSWLDPFFPGPAPIGDLPGLGDRYRDLSILGEGAAARVYKAMDTLLQRHVAIKVLKEPQGQTLVEARAQAQVEHTNVCRIYEVGRGFIVMQLAEGPNLAQVAPSLALEEKLALVRDVALGVHAAHQKGLIHLDLKLNNILIHLDETGGRHPVVSDFGMVRSEGTPPLDGCPMGTPPYTSPEQLRGEVDRLGRATDVYALGVMLYVLITGLIPFECHSFPELLAAIVSAPPVPLRQRQAKLPKDLERLVLHCLEKQPEARYATALELAEDLDRFLRAEPVRAMGGGRWYQLVKWLGRNRKLRWFGGVSLALLLGTAAVMTRHNRFVVQQAEWDHHFQKTVEEIRTALDQVYRLPAHDIEPDLSNIRTMIQTLEQGRRTGGMAAAGPGDLALGQAYFLLEPKDARAMTYLQKAWDGGYQVESVRSWLSLALIRRYQAERRAILSQIDKPEEQKLQLEACRQYLIQARRVLSGRPSQDLTRLKHMVELSEASSGPTPEHDKLIQLAQGFRTRFPNDPEALLEEAEALNAKADALAASAAASTRAYPAVCSAQVEPLRQEGGALINRLAEMTPSHPGVYAAQARWYIRQDEWPTEQTPPQSVLYSQAKQALTTGLKVSPHNTQLMAQLARFLGDQELVRRLQAGLDPSPIAHELIALLQSIPPSENSSYWFDIANALCNYSLTCQAYGSVPTLPLDTIALDLSTRGGQYPLLVGPILGKALMETGQDPVPCLTAVLQANVSAEEIVRISRVSINLVLAEHAWLVGADARTFLGEAEAILQSMKSGAILKNELALSLALWRATVLDEPDTWTQLESAIRQLQSIQAEPQKSYALMYLWQGQLALAKHRLDTGQEALSIVDDLRTALQSKNARQLFPDVYRDGVQASIALLEARVSVRPLPILLEGLATTQRLTSTLPTARSKSSGQYVRSSKSDRLRGYSISFGRALQTKGEIMLALAQSDPALGARRRWGRDSEVAFRQAMRFNKNLKRLVAPLLQRAQAFQVSPGGPSARP